jgi:hypothetical protein
MHIAGGEMTDLSPFQHPRFARMYEQMSAESERRATAEHRDRALAGLTGRVIEVGAGNGVNFSHYPDTVTDVVAVEPENYLRALAERAADQAPIPVRVLAGHATALPVDPRYARSTGRGAAGAETRWRASLFEHVRCEKPWFALLEDAITPLQSRIGGGCHSNRDTAAAIRAAGFDIEELDRFYYAPLRFYPSHAHVLGRARPRPVTQ